MAGKKQTTPPPPWWRVYAKGIVAFAVTVIGGGIAQGLIVGASAAWLTITIGALTTVGVVAKANASP